MTHLPAFAQIATVHLQHKQRVPNISRMKVHMQVNLPARKRVAETLAEELPKQYEEPNQLDWGIYDSSITFDDPMIQLRGKLMYKGMILTIAVIVRALFVSSDFELSECAIMDEGDRVRTVFRTRGRTKWGTDVLISGVDYFWFGENDTLVRHQSTWDQTAAEVTKAFWGK